MKVSEQNFPVVPFIILSGVLVVLAFESVVEILKCGQWIERYWTTLSFGTVVYDHSNETSEY